MCLVGMVGRAVCLQGSKSLPGISVPFRLHCVQPALTETNPGYTHTCEKYAKGGSMVIKPSTGQQFSVVKSWTDNGGLSPGGAFSTGYRQTRRGTVLSGRTGNALPNTGKAQIAAVRTNRTRKLPSRLWTWSKYKYLFIYKMSVYI